MAPRPPIAWRLLLALAGVKLFVHAVSNGPMSYGLMTDELYYLDCAERLGWGYVDHPPFSIAVLRVFTAIFGKSDLAVGLAAVLSTTACLVLTGLTARELGGGRIAQGLAAGMILASPLHLSMGSFHSMNALDLALWAGAYWLLARLSRDPRPRWWLALGVVVGVGLLNKFSMSWFAGGLAVGMLLTQERRWLATPWPWLAAAIAGLIFAPHIAWQVAWGWPTLEFLESVRAKEIVAASPLTFLGVQLFILGVPLWWLGVTHLLASPKARPYRHLGWIVIGVVAFLAMTGSAKLYYAAPAYSVACAATGLALESIAARDRFRWVPRLTAVVLCVAGVAGAPFVISLLPLESLVTYQRMIGAQGVTVDAGEVPKVQQGFAQMFHGRAIASAVDGAFAELPPDERRDVAILAHHFGASGGIRHYGDADLPRSLGTHNQYWLWGPGERDARVIIEVADDQHTLRASCAEYTLAAEIECEYCMPWLRSSAVYVCRGLREPLHRLWPRMKVYR